MLDLDNEPIEEEIMNMLDYYAESAGYTTDKVIEWYKKLRNYECFREEVAEGCMDIICSRRNDANSDTEYATHESVRNSIEFALCDVLGIEALKDADISDWVKSQYGYNSVKLDYDNGENDYMELIDEDDLNIRK